MATQSGTEKAQSFTEKTWERSVHLCVALCPFWLRVVRVRISNVGVETPRARPLALLALTAYAGSGGEEHGYCDHYGGDNG